MKCVRKVPSRPFAGWIATLLLVLAAGAGAAQPTTRAQRARKAKPKEPARKLIKFMPAAPEQVAANRQRALEIAETIRAFAPRLRLLETPHFLIFTEWGRRDDKALADICEKMYRAMCRQFNIPAKQNIWAGKCPIYVFRKNDHYVRFTKALGKAEFAAAAGFQYHQEDGFGYIVMNRAGTRRRFYEVLVHEATHAFIGRYLTNLPVPRWVNEGLAEYMAAMLVPGCQATKTYKKTSREAVKEQRDVGHIFHEVGLNRSDYDIAQSLVRFLIARDRKAFIRFIRFLKEGKGQHEALKDAFNLTAPQLLDAWRQAVVKFRGYR